MLEHVTFTGIDERTDLKRRPPPRCAPASAGRRSTCRRPTGRRR